jgi:hypothetical protein
MDRRDRAKEGKLTVPESTDSASGPAPGPAPGPASGPAPGTAPGPDLPLAEGPPEPAAVQRPLDRLLQQALRPLNVGEVLPCGPARLEMSAVKQNLKRRKRLRLQLRTYKGPDPGEWARRGLAAGRAELWQRAIQIIARLSGEEARDRQIAKNLAHELDALLRDGRREELAAVCDALSAGSGAADDEDAPGRRSLQRVLQSLASSAWILTLQQRLAHCSGDELELLLRLIGLLPPPADLPLVQMLDQLPAGEAAGRLEALLRERGTDLMNVDIRRLRSDDEELVLAAIKSLGSNGSSRAVEALAGALEHSGSVARAAALRALKEPARRGRVPLAATPQIVAGLASPVADLRRLSFELLEALPHTEGARDLMELVRQDGQGRWDADARMRALQLLVRWGGPVASEFLVKRVSAANVFRRQNVEEARSEVIEAARQVAGEQGRALLQACLKAGGVPGSVQDQLKAALEELS